MKKLFVMLLLSATGSMAQTVTLIPAGSSWKYLDNGTNQGTSWRTLAFNDAAWATGNAELGYGDGDEATILSYGPNPNLTYVTTYFRKVFNVTSPAAYSGLVLNLLRDDGAVVYLNGTEVARSNLPSSTITYLTRASSAISGSGESTYYNFTPPVSLLVPGANVIAVEIHQFHNTSTDISFNLRMDAIPAATTCGIPGALATNSITTSSAMVTWGAVAGASNYNLRYRPAGSTNWVTVNTGSISYQLNSLTAATLYEFSVQAVCASGPGNFSGIATFTTNSSTNNDTLITAFASWKYLDNGSNPGTSWIAPAYNDAAWASGNAELGYGDGDEATVVSYGSNSSAKYITTYFRRAFNVTNPASFSSLNLNVIRDDGIIVYLNGAEIYRNNMPAGAPSYNTLSSTAIAQLDEKTWYATTLPPSVLTTGTNVIAVEIHQFHPTSTDLSFNLSLAATPAAACGIPGSLASNSITASTAFVSWSSVPGATSYNLRFRPSGSTSWVTVNTTSTSFQLTGLTSGTLYEFSSQAVCATGSSNYSATAAFTTLSSTSCGVPNSISSSSISSTGATVSWNTVSGAVSYNVNIRKVGTTTWTTLNSSGTSQQLTGLTPGMTYEYFIQAVCATGTGNNSSIATFSTYVNGIDSLIATFDSWKFLDNGTNQGTAWMAPAYNDATWQTGNAELGYGDGDESTIVSYGINGSAKYITTYFRKSFNVTNPSAYAALNLDVVRDDGIVVYLNGNEVYRNNMPAGPIAYNTLSSTAIAGSDESTWYSTALSPADLVTGTNVMAVEIHQQDPTSSDLSFKARLVAAGAVPLPLVTRGAYLQKVTPSSITIRWRTNVPCDSKVNFGTTTGYGNSISNADLTTEHIITLTGLDSKTKYFYAIGTSTNILQGDNQNWFLTSPAAGGVTPVRVWVTGDFGNGSTQQIAVRDAFTAYTASSPANLWLWLGDNAYSSGTDAQYQTYVFEKYPEQLKNIPLYPSPGNHDYGNVGYQSQGSLSTNFAYYNNFSPPQLAEAGGMPSHTPKYYSFDYANIHFISLDSYGALNHTTSPMYTWLQNDLAANTQRWTVVYFHHPPYSKGTHDSDTETEMINMRRNIIPLLENYHVDLVLSGHSHINERSYLIKGHYGSSTTFTPGMKVSTATNIFSKTAPYDGTIYAVCGTSGQNPGVVQAGYTMPCMYFNNNVNNCSLILDVNGDNLFCKYLASTGNILDEFSITKTGAREMVLPEPETVNISYDTDENSVVVDYFLGQETRVGINLFNMSGQLINRFDEESQTLPSGFHRVYLDVPSLATGLYLLKVTVNEKSYHSKILIP